MVKIPKEAKCVISRMLKEEMEKKRGVKMAELKQKFAEKIKQYDAIEKQKEALNKKINELHKEYDAKAKQLNIIAEEINLPEGYYFSDLFGKGKSNKNDLWNWNLDRKLQEDTDFIYGKLLIIDDKGKWEKEMAKLISTMVK